jgi:ABC-type sugar transport system substrate-binding protein
MEDTLMNRFKRLLAFLALALAIAVILVGCGGGGAGSGAELKVGYVVNFGAHEWYQNVIKGAQDTAKEKGIEFDWADANVDLSKQISQAESMLTQGVDVLVLSPVDPKGLSTVMSQAKERGVPVITESNPIPGAETVVGIQNLEAGIKIGEWTGEYVKDNVDGGAQVLIVGLPTQADTRDRVAGFKKGMENSGAEFEIAQEVNGGGIKDQALEASTDAITANKDINLIYGINDDSALGATQAYEQAGLDPSKLTTIGFGVEGQAGKSALMAGGPYKAGLGMFPEYVGRTIIDQAEKVANDKSVPEHTVTPIEVLTEENLTKYYSKGDNGWQIKYDAVASLLKD